jgi:hypothetical protein
MKQLNINEICTDCQNKQEISWYTEYTPIEGELK